MLGDQLSDLEVDAAPTRMNRPDRLQKFATHLALEHVGLSARLDGTLCQDVPQVGGQHDDACRFELAPDGGNGVDAAHVGHLQVHQRHIGSEQTELFYRLAPVRRLARELDVGRFGDQREDAFPHERMVVH